MMRGSIRWVASFAWPTSGGGIIEGHPYMAPFRAEVLLAVEAPTDLIEQQRAGQDWFYLRDAGQVGGSRS